MSAFVRDVFSEQSVISAFVQDLFSEQSVSSFEPVPEPTVQNVIVKPAVKAVNWTLWRSAFCTTVLVLSSHGPLLSWCSPPMDHSCLGALLPWTTPVLLEALVSGVCPDEFKREIVPRAPPPESDPCIQTVSVSVLFCC